MPIWLIWIIVIALYARTYNYFYVIDDYVKRDGYPIPPKESVDPSFYDTKPTWYYRAFMIAMHCVNTSVIYLLWGWEPALLFAVHPMSVWGVAWVTGGFYATTLYFTLIAYYIIHQFPNIWGSMAGAGIFWAALNSTYCCLSFPFLYLFNGQWWGLSLFVPLVFWLRSKRFKAGLESRLTIIKGCVIEKEGIKLNRLALMTKVVARYIWHTLVPMKVFFFGQWGEFNRDFKDVYDDLHAWDKYFWASLALCTAVFVGGCMINFEMTMWFFLGIGLHSQWNLIGQFIAQRYIYFSLPAMCVLVGTLLHGHPMVVIFLAGWLAMKTHTAIPSWRHQEDLLLNEVAQNPTRGDSHSTMAQYYLHKKHINQYPRWMVNRISMFVRRGVELNSRSWQNWMNYAAFMMMVGRIPESIEATKRCKELLTKVASDQNKPLFQELDAQILRLENMLVQIKRDIKKGMLKPDISG